jgi:hypothetical protein
MFLIQRKKTSSAPPADLQDAADSAAWRLLLRRRPDVADRIRGALAAGRPLETVIAAATDGWPRLRLLLPCAVHGCARSLGRRVDPRRTA